MMDRFYVPAYLNAPPRWLFWTLDEAALLLSCFVLGILNNHILLLLLIAIISLLCLKKLKNLSPDVTLLAVAYWYLPLGKRAFKAIPPSYIREYIG